MFKLSNRAKRNIAIRYAMSNNLNFKKVRDIVKQISASNEEELFHELEKIYKE